MGFTMMIVAHLNACIFYWIGRLNIGNSWISKYMFGCCDTSITLFNAQNYGANGTDCFDPSLLPATDTMYVDAVYWSLTTLATVGYGDITPCNEMEQLYTAAAMVIGIACLRARACEKVCMRLRTRASCKHSQSEERWWMCWLCADICDAGISMPALAHSCRECYVRLHCWKHFHSRNAEQRTGASETQ